MASRQRPNHIQRTPPIHGRRGSSLTPSSPSPLHINDRSQSAGAHLSALICFHLINARPAFAFTALILNYGIYDLSFSLPQSQHFKKQLILSPEVVAQFVNAVLPGVDRMTRQAPHFSPFYVDLTEVAARTQSGALPPAFFSVGTQDILLDDTMMMALKWRMSGAEAMVKVYAGAPHGFTLFRPGVSDASGEFRGDVGEFLREKVEMAAKSSAG